MDKSAVNNRIFAHENHRWPPSLASNGVMHHLHQMNRSDLMECLESLAGQAKSVPDAESVPAAVDAKILDGAAIVHMLNPKKSRLPVRTFQDYSQSVLLSYVENVLQDVSPIDIVWDVYRKDSLKTQAVQARQNRGFWSSCPSG